MLTGKVISNIGYSGHTSLFFNFWLQVQCYTQTHVSVSMFFVHKYRKNCFRPFEKEQTPVSLHKVQQAI